MVSKLHSRSLSGDMRMRFMPIATTVTLLCVVTTGARLSVSSEPALGATQPLPSAAATSPTAQNALPSLRPATFQGVTPCADCPGVQVTVTLKSDGTYTLRRVYLERKGTFEEKGTWSYDTHRARLTLFPDKGSPEMFSVTFSSQLHMLDANGDPLPSRMSSTLAQVDTVVPTLASTSWTLDELVGLHLTTTELHAVNLVFDALGERVSGSGGCNRYTGPYKQEGATLTFGALAATRMACPNLGEEDAYFAALAKVASFRREGDMLMLMDKSGKPLATFQYRTNL